VSETQKLEIARILNRRNWNWRFRAPLLLLIALPVIIPLGLFHWDVQLGYPWSTLLIYFLLLGLWAQGVLNVLNSLALGSILADLQRSRERIGAVEAIKTYAGTSPAWHWLCLSLLQAAMCGGALVYTPLTFDYMVAAATLGLTTCFFLVLFWLQLKARHSAH
jgi:hypothetical protein